MFCTLFAAAAGTVTFFDAVIAVCSAVTASATAATAVNNAIESHKK